MEKIYTFDLQIFDLDNHDCKNNIKKFIKKINNDKDNDNDKDKDNNEKIIIKFTKNNKNIVKNMANVSNIIYFANKLSKIKEYIKKIIIKK